MEGDGLAGGSGRLETLRRGLAEAFYRGFRPVMLAAIRVYFRRATLIGRERFPDRGAALIVANHPSTWSDVLLLDGLLGRRIHFLSESGQFRPRPRGMLLRLFGTLPLFSAKTEPRHAERNEETFRRCRALFDRGEAVAIFPEGISRTDRSLMPLRPGASMLARSYAMRGDANPSFSIVLVGLRYSDRTAFRSDVSLKLDDPIPLSMLRDVYAGPVTEEADRLTLRMAGALRSLAGLAEDPRDGWLLSRLEPIVAVRERGRDRASAEALERAIISLRHDDPDRYRRLRLVARRHARILRALRVSDAALAARHRAGVASSLRWGAAAALTAVPAFAGAAIHAVPFLSVQAVVRHVAYAPSEIAFARIASGTFFLLLTYAALGGVFTRFLHAGPALAAGLLALCAVLGLFALAFGYHARARVERARVARIARRHPRLVQWARRGQDALGRWASGVADAPGPPS
ncbi:MAG TPA: 1-acyl-sn-glycerol-3-phosphate acyltransferase [Candidatus Eisenbacteria bacterium]|nr:1-acyl-sn-glycerol-3-phosphate acyltransferase [Candidatus Eisenbacteria bacterium]